MTLIYVFDHKLDSIVNWNYFGDAGILKAEQIKGWFYCSFNMIYWLPQPTKLRTFYLSNGAQKAINTWSDIAPITLSSGRVCDITDSSARWRYAPEEGGAAEAADGHVREAVAVEVHLSVDGLPEELQGLAVSAGRDALRKPRPRGVMSESLFKSSLE